MGFWRTYSGHNASFQARAMSVLNIYCYKVVKNKLRLCPNSIRNTIVQWEDGIGMQNRKIMANTKKQIIDFMLNN